MTIKNVVIVDGKEIEINDLEDKAAFAQSVNEKVLLERNYIIDNSA